MTNICPECGSKKIVCSTRYGEVTCVECGIVLDDSPIEQNPFISEPKKSLAMPSALSIAGTQNIDGKIIKNSWLLSTKEKNLNAAKKNLELISSKLKLTEITNKEAFTIFKLAVDRNLNIGRDNNTLLYASVYAACIMQNIPKTPLEVVAYSGISRAKMLRSYRLLKEKLGLKICKVDPIDFVHRFASRLHLKQPTITLAIEIISKIKDSPYCLGKHPKTIVASALYLASKIKNDYRTQRDIANATGVIEVTIRKRSKEINDIIF